MLRVPTTGWCSRLLTRVGGLLVSQVVDVVEQRVRSERIKGTGSTLSASELHSYLGRVFYNRRNKMDPYWNSVLVSGYKDGEAYVRVPVLVVRTLCSK